MLRELLHRDWILNRRTLLFTYGTFGLFQSYFALQVSSPRVWLVFASIYASFLAVALFVRDDMFQATAWTCSLPVLRRQIVAARFLGAWILVLSALAGATLLAAIIPGSVVAPSELADPTTLLLAAATITIVIGLLLPFTIRFGMIGVVIFLVVAQALGAGVLIATTMLARHGDGHGSGDLIHDGTTLVGGAVASLRTMLHPLPFLVLAVLALIALNWTGYRVGTWLFGRREL